MKIWLQKVSLKFKIFLTILASFLGLFFFLLLRKNFLARDKLNYELSKKEHEISLKQLEEESFQKREDLIALRAEKDQILSELEILEAQEVELGREISASELENFFQSRGL